VVEQHRAKPVVVYLTSGDAEPHQQAVGIDNNMDLAGEPATRAAHVLFAAIGDAGSVLVHAHDRGVDHLHYSVVGGTERLHEAVPDTGPPPADEAIEASRVGTIQIRQIAPRRS